MPNKFILLARIWYVLYKNINSQPPKKIGNLLPPYHITGQHIIKYKAVFKIKYLCHNTSTAYKFALKRVILEVLPL
jgi:hypothetical protein